MSVLTTLGLHGVSRGVILVEASPLAAGTASVLDERDGRIVLSATDAAGGTSPYTYQWQRSTTSGSGFSNVSGATALSLNNTGLTNGTTYYYRLVYTDDASDSVTSAEVSGTPAVPSQTSSQGNPSRSIAAAIARPVAR